MKAFLKAQPRLSALLLVLLAGCGPQGPASTLRVGDTFPEFRLKSLDGAPMTSEQARQARRPVVVNFWATWCGPCVREIPTLNQIHASNEVSVVAVSLDKAGADEVKAFVRSHEVSYPVAIGGLDLFRRLGGEVVPFTLVLDPDLRLIAAHRGLVSLHTLERDLARATESRAGAG